MKSEDQEYCFEGEWLNPIIFPWISTKTAYYQSNISVQINTLAVDYDPDYPCSLCGRAVTSASMGGTVICGSCDCGIDLVFKSGKLQHSDYERNVETQRKKMLEKMADYGYPRR